MRLVVWFAVIKYFSRLLDYGLFPFHSLCSLLELLLFDAAACCLGSGCSHDNPSANVVVDHSGPLDPSS